MRTVLFYAGLLAALLTPIVVAAGSPLLEWRRPVYIVSGFAGVLGLCILLLQALLASDSLPAIAVRQSRKLHRWVGAALVITVVLHVAGLWLTSPPDVVDALLFRSPTLFSVWGVVAMWMLFCTAAMALLRVRIIQSFSGKRGQRLWRRVHSALAVFVVTGTVIHSLLIEGTMGSFSKWLVCLLVLSATFYAIRKKRAES